MVNPLPSDTASSATTGIDRSHVCIADITIAFESHDPELRLRIAGAMGKFLVAARAADVTVRTRWADLAAIELGDQLFDSGGIWKLYTDGHYYSYCLTAPFSDWQPYRIARFNADFTDGEILCERRYFAPDEPVYPLEYPLDELVFLNHLAQGRGVEIHGCGLRDAAGNGYLFPGQSGAGKSTMARLWSGREGVTIVSDERVVLRKQDGQIWMHGTPWHGDARIAQPGKAVLNRVYFLRHGSANESVPVSPTAAAARLFACCFPPFHSADGVGFTLDFLAELAQSIPTHELRFLPDPHVVELLEQGKLG
jgi:hypothetical protein